MTTQISKIKSELFNLTTPEMEALTRRDLWGPKGKVEGSFVWAVKESQKVASPAWDEITTDEWCQNIINIIKKGEINE